MIDTDKYEGHTPGPWCLQWGPNETITGISELGGETIDGARDGHEPAATNTRLIADAPLLLEEVKWLRSLIEMVSYDLEWYPERFEQNKRQLAYNVRKWNGEEE